PGGPRDTLLLYVAYVVEQPSAEGQDRVNGPGTETCSSSASKARGTERSSFPTSIVNRRCSAMADTATFSGAMKTMFIGPIRDILPQGKVLLFGDSYANPTDFKGILPSAEGIDMVGNEFRIPMKVRRNQSVGFRMENEFLPAPGASQYSYLSEPMRYAYALFNITGQLFRAAESNEGAFVSAFKQEMDDTTLASKLDFN